MYRAYTNSLFTDSNIVLSVKAQCFLIRYKYITCKMYRENVSKFRVYRLIFSYYMSYQQGLIRTYSIYTHTCKCAKM